VVRCLAPSFHNQNTHYDSLQTRKKFHSQDTAMSLGHNVRSPYHEVDRTPLIIAGSEIALCNKRHKCLPHRKWQGRITYPSGFANLVPSDGSDILSILRSLLCRPYIPESRRRLLPPPPSSPSFGSTSACDNTNIPSTPKQLSYPAMGYGPR
jgi:hypothetical protein